MRTLFTGKNVIFLHDTESTNSYATHLLKNVNHPEGTVVYTHNQTAGKGRRGSTWQSEAGKNLTASFVLKPTFLTVGEQFYLYQITALACLETARVLLGPGHPLQIKWPNDIVAGEKKIAGILIENNLMGGRINWTVAGTGLNLNQTDFSGLPGATSAKAIAGRDFSIEETLETLSMHLEKHYLALKQNRKNTVYNLYLDNLYGLNERMNFMTKGGNLSMTIKGLTKQGALLLEDNDGKQAAYDADEIRMIVC